LYLVHPTTFTEIENIAVSGQCDPIVSCTLQISLTQSRVRREIQLHSHQHVHVFRILDFRWYIHRQNLRELQTTQDEFQEGMCKAAGYLAGAWDDC
jgi:hypothetical protein